MWFRQTLTTPVFTIGEQAISLLWIIKVIVLLILVSIIARGIKAIYENKKISNLIFTFSQGEYFGELPLLLQVPYPTTMIAATETTLFLIGKNCFQNLLDNYPCLVQEVAEELAKRQDTLKNYQQQLKDMGLMDEQYLQNPVMWIRQRLTKIFSLKI
ncbi:MAG TPA: hypothetical protein DCF68_00695 [Cyanothece sp. UBA12306]|nr:hypothetical protein [Cyanothece sp. UBA12306]